MIKKFQRRIILMNKREVTRFTREEIANKVKELGKQISKDYVGKNLVAIGLLRGSFVFLADLVREIDNPIVVDFITTSSYEHSEISTGTVNIISDFREDIEGKDVLIVDDIMDSGNTLKNIREYLKNSCK